MLRATGRRAFGSFLTRNFNSNQNGKEGSQENDHKDASDKENARYCNLEELIGLQRMIFQSIGIFGSMFVLGYNFHTDCCSTFKARGRNCNKSNSGCAFLASLYKNLPRLGPHHGNNRYPFTSVLPIHAQSLATSPSSASCEQSKKDDSSLKEKLSQMLRNELDLVADEYKNIQATVLLQSNKVNEAISLLKSCPRSAKAMFNLGIVYESGKHDPINGEPNYIKAAKYYTDAAGMGHTKACYNLGLIYYYDKHPESDRSIGLNLLQKAAKLGDQEAQNFFELQRIKAMNARHEMKRKSEQLFNKINNKSSKNTFHTSRSSPNFLSSIMSYLQPTVNDLKPTLEEPLSEHKLLMEYDSDYENSDDLEVVFSCE